MEAEVKNGRPPTDRQIELLAFMAEYFETQGRWPSHREMAAALTLNTSNLNPYLTLLEAKGLLRRLEGQSRRNRALTALGRQIVIEKEWQPRLL